MFQVSNGDPRPEYDWPEYEWPSEDDWSESEDDQEQVGHRNKVKRRHSFDMSFVFEIHFSSLLVALINAL